jgi:ComF family protein
MACQPKIRSWVDEAARRAAGAFWPWTCVLCGRRGCDGLDLCAECDEELPRVEPARLPAFHAACIPYRYAYPIDHVIQAFKYGGQAHCGRVLGTLLARHLLARRQCPWPQCVLPMPLGARRYRERGFNQAIELARCLRAIDGLVVRTDIIARVRETTEQASLDRIERRSNVRGAFRLERPLQVDHVAILDDVVTTASTVSEVAKLLRGAGVRRIEVWAIARSTNER